MLCAGDEFGDTQFGNNNAYCQDNEISWLNWDLNDEQRALLEFTRKVIQLRQHQPVLHRRRFFQGRAIRGSNVKDICWFGPAGEEMDDQAWHSAGHAIGVRLAGDVIEDVDENGQRIAGDTLLVLLNASHVDVEFTLPPAAGAQRWQLEFDTFPRQEKERYAGGDIYPLHHRSLVALRLIKPIRHA